MKVEPRRRPSEYVRGGQRVASLRLSDAFVKREDFACRKALIIRPRGVKLGKQLTLFGRREPLEHFEDADLNFRHSRIVTRRAAARPRSAGVALR